MKFERMKTIREDMDLTQQEVANKLGIERSTYAGWETGKDTIPLSQLNALSNYYEMSIDYITGLSNINNYNKRHLDIDVIAVGNKLKEFRISYQLKQKDLFELLNTTSSTYSAYETGKVLIQTSFIYKIAEKYNISIDYIIEK